MGAYHSGGQGCSKTAFTAVPCTTVYHTLLQERLGYFEATRDFSAAFVFDERHQLSQFHTTSVTVFQGTPQKISAVGL
jgi:hypothetical protein